MAEISRLSRLLNGVQRGVDLSTNTLVVGDIKIGGGAGTLLTQTILNRLIALQNGSDVDATYHTHDGRYFTETELGSSSASSGSDLIGDDNTYSNFTPAAATVKGALSGIDTALATGSGRVKVTTNDTSSDFLDPTLLVDVGTNSTDALEKSIINPGANEQLRVRFDASKVDHGALAGLGDDDHTQYIRVDGTRAFTGNQSMGSNKITSMADPTAAQDAATKNYVDTQDALKVSKSGDSMTGNLAMGGNLVTGLGAPTAGTDAANKNYVDAAIAGLSWKNSARVATTADITLAPAPASIDGVTLVTGDRVLVKNQNTGSQNGIYSFDGTDLVRASDADVAAELLAAAIFVREGTANADTAWVQTVDSITLGTTALVFSQFAGNGTIQAGVGLSYSGNTLNVNLGAGIQQLPTDEVGIDLHSTSGLMLTEDGSTPSASGDAQLSVRLDGSTIAKSGSGIKVADAGITATQLAASVAGDGLTGGAGSPLAVGAGDGIDVAADSISVDVSDLAGTGLENDGSNNLRIAASAAGDGLVGGGGSALAVGAGDGIDVAADAISVDVSDLAGSGLENDGSNNLRIAASAAGAGLTGGGGSALSVTYAPALRKNTVTVGESFAANGTYVVRWAMNGETAGRIYKADKDASSTDRFHVIGVISVGGTALSAGDTANLMMYGSEVARETNDPALVAGDVGKPVFLSGGGALVLTAPSAASEAVVIVGIVKDTSTFWIQPQIMGVN